MLHKYVQNSNMIDHSELWSTDYILEQNFSCICYWIFSSQQRCRALQVLITVRLSEKGTKREIAEFLKGQIKTKLRIWFGCRLFVLICLLKFLQFDVRGKLRRNILAPVVLLVLPLIWCFCVLKASIWFNSLLEPLLLCAKSHKTKMFFCPCRPF